MRYVSYTRTTSCFEWEEIPQNVIGLQNEHIAAYAKKHGFTIEEKYSDRKKSNEENAGFEKLLEDGMQRKFDCVVVDSVFRSGNTLWVANEVLLQTFHYAGIYFIVVEDDFNSKEKGTEAAEQYFREKYKVYRSRSLIYLNHKRQRSGQYNWIDIKYGYQLVDGEMIRDENQAPVVERVFTECLSGKTAKEIADGLKADQILSPSCDGRYKREVIDKYNWKSKTVLAMLKRDAYTGSWEKRAGDEKILMLCEPLISKSDFDKVQTLLPKTKKVKGKHISSPISRMLYDAFSNERLNLRKEHDGVFTLVGEGKGYTINEDNSIPFKAAEEMVLQELKLERALAEDIAQKIKAGLGIASRKRCTVQISIQMRNHFERVANMEHQSAVDYAAYRAGTINEMEYLNRRNIVLQKLQEAESLFQTLSKEFDQIEIAFSMKNPWLKLMLEWDESQPFTRDRLNKIIDKVYVQDFKKIHLVTKKDEWKQRLPQEWIGGLMDGTKE